MSIITVKATALARLKRKCGADQVPVMTDAELTDILDDNNPIVIWTSDTLYGIGDRVIPTEDNRTGRKFKCASPGRSGVTEPVWLDFSIWVNTISAGVVIGNMGSNRLVIGDSDALWCDDGFEEDLWDIDEAISEAWAEKAAKASDMHRLNRGGSEYDFEAIFRHCQDQASRYGGHFVK